MKVQSITFGLVLFAYSAISGATSLKDYTPYNYEVLFTNPVCKTYTYDGDVESNGGELLYSKPKGAYCKSSDSRASGNRHNAPQRRLIDWIRSSETKNIFLSYLSFSNRTIAKELCKAVEKRDVKITLVFDSNNEADAGRMATANFLGRCKNKDTGNSPYIVTRGNHSGLGYAHNKVFMVNAGEQKGVKIAFSSGNMSSGVTTHHENWHFVTTSPISHFAKMHECLRDGMLDHANSKKEYISFIRNCRAGIDSPAEDDIKVYFIPGDGREATAAIDKAMGKAVSINMAAHRFSYGTLMKMISKNLKKGKKFNLVVDDDIYWTGVYGQGMGRNTTFEYGKVSTLRKQGMKVKYMETYADDVWEPRSLQLQHNKFLVFNNKDGSGAVFAGAGNLTGSAFTKNFENFYMVTIPEVHQAFVTQYDHMWNDLATGYSNMPTELVLP
ncbi:MAG: hypothetical protein KC493_16925 [Bacteriovoracaceae bacterium]|nr:hypothetical protein [Bacteriovoracaceae bacterium]